MNCENCKKGKATVKYVEKKVCNSCFSRLIEKRIRKYVRLNKFFRKNDRILIMDRFSEYLVKKIIKGLPVKIFYKEIKTQDFFNNKKIKQFAKTKKANKIVFPWTLDDEAILFLESFFNNKKTPTNLGITTKYIKLLRPVTFREVNVLARIKGFKFRQNIKTPVYNMLDNIEKKHPQTRFSLLRSINQLCEVLSK